MLDCPRGGLCCHASLCLHAHTDPPGRLCAFVWDSVSTIFQNGHNQQHIISEKGQQRKESKLRYVMEEKCWLLLSFKPMVKHRKTVLQIIATLTRVCLHCDGLDTPPTEKRKLWIISLCGFVLPNFIESCVNTSSFAKFHCEAPGILPSVSAITLTTLCHCENEAHRCCLDLL